MGFTTPATWSVGMLDTAALMNSNLRDNMNWLSAPPRCRVYATAAQSIPNSSITAVLFPIETYDSTGTMHSTTSNTSRLYSTVAGLFAVNMSATFNANSTGVRQIVLYKNGAQLANSVNVSQAANGSTFTLTAYDEVQMSTSDYLECWVVQTSGAALNINTIPSFMSIRWVATS